MLQVLDFIQLSLVDGASVLVYVMRCLAKSNLVRLVDDALMSWILIYDCICVVMLLQLVTSCIYCFMVCVCSSCRSWFIRFWFGFSSKNSNAQRCISDLGFVCKLVACIASWFPFVPF